MNTTLQRAINISVAIAYLLGSPASAQTQSDSTVGQSDLIRAAIVDNTPNDHILLDRAVALGPSAAPQIELLLDHVDEKVRRRAFAVLCRIPEAAPSTIVTVLSSDDYQLRMTAMSYAPTYFGREDVTDAFTRAMFAQPLSSGTIYHGRTVAVSLNETGRRSLGTRVVPAAREALLVLMNSREHRGDYPASVAHQLAILLGMLAEPGDRTTVAAIEQMVQGADARFVGTIDEPVRRATMEEERDRALEAAQFALANLGDKGALEAFAASLRSGTPESRFSRFKLLGLMRVTPGVLEMLAPILEDKTAVGERVTPSGVEPPIFKRACDNAIDLLGERHKDSFPFKTFRTTIYNDQQLAAARDWLRAKIVESKN